MGSALDAGRNYALLSRIHLVDERDGREGRVPTNVELRSSLVGVTGGRRWGTAAQRAAGGGMAVVVGAG